MEHLLTLLKMAALRTKPGIAPPASRNTFGIEQQQATAELRGSARVSPSVA
jgi:hypothetical protein